MTEIATPQKARLMHDLEKHILPEVLPVKDLKQDSFLDELKKLKEIVSEICSLAYEDRNSVTYIRRATAKILKIYLAHQEREDPSWFKSRLFDEVTTKMDSATFLDVPLGELARDEMPDSSLVHYMKELFESLDTEENIKCSLTYREGRLHLHARRPLENKKDPLLSALVNFFKFQKENLWLSTDFLNWMNEKTEYYPWSSTEPGALSKAVWSRRHHLHAAGYGVSRMKRPGKSYQYKLWELQ